MSWNQITTKEALAKKKKKSFLIFLLKKGISEPQDQGKIDLKSVSVFSSRRLSKPDLNVHILTIATDNAIRNKEHADSEMIMRINHTLWVKNNLPPQLEKKIHSAKFITNQFFAVPKSMLKLVRAFPLPLPGFVSSLSSPKPNSQKWATGRWQRCQAEEHNYRDFSEINS